MKGRKRESWQTRVGNIGWPLAFILGAAALWEILVRAWHIPKWLMPALSVVLLRIGSDASFLATHASYTLYVILAGFSLAIAVALVHDPPLLLMDEPFGALDNLTREQLTLDFQHIWMETKKTVFFVTHNILEAVFLSDRVVGMTPRPGRIDLIEKIDIPRPRTWDLLGSERFGHYVEKLRNMFRSQGVLCDAKDLPGLAGKGPSECRVR